jgi:hypothetical protein
MGKNIYRHMVIFDLHSGTDSEETSLFLSDGERILTDIPGIKDFQVCRQVSPKNDFPFCFLMDFDSIEIFKAYEQHPNHSGFVNERWIPEVSRFMEIDLIVSV